MENCNACNAQLQESDMSCVQCGAVRAVPHDAPAPMLEGDSPPALPEVHDLEHYQQTINILRAPVRKVNGWLLLIPLSGFGLVAGRRGWTLLLLVAAVLLFAGLGRFCASCAFGQANARYFLWPVVGASAASRTPNPNGWQRSIILLAGSVPGILLGTALLSGGPMQYAVGIFLVAVNGINLLPAPFLAGTPFINGLIVSKTGYPELVVSLAGAAALAVVTAKQGWWCLTAVALVINTARLQIELAHAVSNLTGDFPPQIEDCSDQLLRELYNGSFSALPMFSKGQPKTMARLMRMMHWRRTLTRPSPAAVATLLAIYAGSAALVLFDLRGR